MLALLELARHNGLDARLRPAVPGDFEGGLPEANKVTFYSPGCMDWALSTSFVYAEKFDLHTQIYRNTSLDQAINLARKMAVEEPAGVVQVFLDPARPDQIAADDAQRERSRKASLVELKRRIAINVWLRVLLLAVTAFAGGVLSGGLSLAAIAVAVFLAYNLAQWAKLQFDGLR